MVKNSYVASQKFNTKLQNAREQAALNWNGEVSHFDGGVQFRFYRPDGIAVGADKVIAILRRPATELLDQLVVLNAKGAGLYVGDIKLDTGGWTVEIKADVPQNGGKSVQWRMIYNIYVKNDGSFATVSNIAK